MRKTTRLSDTYTMVEPASRDEAELLYDSLDDEELDELRVVGIDRDAFVEQMVTADHSAAFYDGDVLVFGMCSQWIDGPDGEPVRMWDDMSTKMMRQRWRNFARHTPLMRDAFAAGEPSKRFLGIVKADFRRSVRWAEKCAKFRKIGHIGINNVWHNVYEYRMKED